MEYTAPTPISRGLATVCPTQPLIASANGNVLQIHDVDTNALVHCITTAGAITHIVWSARDRPLLAAASSPGSNIVVVDGSNGAVVADIHDGRLQVSWMVLCGHGRLVVGYEHGIGVGIYEVVATGVLLAFVPFGMRVGRKGLVIANVVSRCDSFVALVVRDGSSEDSVVIVSTHDGKTMGSAKRPGNICRIAGIRWAGNSTLFVWGRQEGSIEDYATVTLTVRGEVLTTGASATGDARADADAGKVAAVRTTSSCEAVGDTCDTPLLAVGCTEGRMRLVDAARWRLIKEFSHMVVETDATRPPVFFRERRRRRQAGDVGDNGEMESCFEVLASSEHVEIGRAKRSDGTLCGAHGADGQLRRDVTWVELSKDGRFVGSRYEGAPHVLLIFEVASMRLAAVLIMQEEIVCARWSTRGKMTRPNEEDDDESEADGGIGSRLAFGCGGAWVYIWEARGAAAVRIGGDHDCDSSGSGDLFGVRKIAWTYNDEALVLVDGASARAFVTVFVAG